MRAEAVLALEEERERVAVLRHRDVVGERQRRVRVVRVQRRAQRAERADQRAGRAVEREEQVVGASRRSRSAPVATSTSTPSPFGRRKWRTNVPPVASTVSVCTVVRCGVVVPVWTTLGLRVSTDASGFGDEAASVSVDARAAAQPRAASSRRKVIRVGDVDARARLGDRQVHACRRAVLQRGRRRPRASAS